MLQKKPTLPLAALPRQLFWHEPQSALWSQWEHPEGLVATLAFRYAARWGARIALSRLLSVQCLDQVLPPCLALQVFLVRASRHVNAAVRILVRLTAFGRAGRPLHARQLRANVVRRNALISSSRSRHICRAQIEVRVSSWAHELSILKERHLTCMAWALRHTPAWQCPCWSADCGWGSSPWCRSYCWELQALCAWVQGTVWRHVQKVCWRPWRLLEWHCERVLLEEAGRAL